MTRHSRIRTLFQAGWFALTNGYARGYTSGKIFTGNTKLLCVPGLNCYSCPGALASCPIGSLQAVLNKSTYRVSLYVVGLLSMFGVLFGRLVCSWMCPFGLVQDLLHKIPLGPKHKNLPGHTYLRWLRFVVLAVMVILLPMLVMDVTGTGQPWFCEWICPSGTLFGGIPLTIVNEQFRAIIGLRFFWKVFLLVVFCLGAVWWYRPFCKYLCPLGAIYGLFNPVSTYRLEIDANKCVKCRACQRACGMDIATFQSPNSMDCIRCGDCMAACPTGAISSTWGTMGQSIKSRCFVDDEAAPARKRTHKVTVASSPYAISTGALRVLGIVMTLVGAIGAASSAYFCLYKDFDKRLNIDGLGAVGPGSLVLGATKVAASLIIALAGIYILRNLMSREKLLTVSEKVRSALLIYLVGIVAAVVNIPFNIYTLTLMASGLYSCYPFLAIPVTWALFAVADRCTKSGRSNKFMWVLYVWTMVASIATGAFGALALFSYMAT